MIKGIKVFVFCIIGLTANRSFAKNPVVSHIFTADAAGLVHDGVFYLYTGHDEASNNDNYDMDDWHVFTSTDMLHWKDQGEVLQVSDFSWARGDAWASQVVKRGNKFYWYICAEHRYIPGKAIGVAVSDTPVGPYTDPRGSALVTNNMTTSVTNIPWDDLDPTAYVDNDGQAYIFWGNTALYWAKLKDSMIELDGDIHSIALPEYTEAPFIHKRQGIYYLSYAAGWPERIDYATSYSITGPWTRRGSIFSQTLPSETNHQSIVEYKGNWYITYHDASLPTGGTKRRSVRIDRLYYTADGSIKEVTMTQGGVDPVGPPPPVTPLPSPRSLIWSGGPFHLDGVKNYGNLPDNLLASCEDCTVTTWVNLNRAPVWSRIFDFGNDRLTYMFLTPDSGNNNIRFAIRDARLGYEQIVNTNTGFPLGSWQHIAVRFANDTVTVYLNGQAIGSNNNITLNPSQMGDGITVNNWIGRSNWPIDPYPIGQIDDFRVYNYALSSSDIFNLANNLTSRDVRNLDWE